MDCQIFDIEAAERIGLNCAIILHNLNSWVRYNEANGKNEYGGHFWAYNSMAAFKKQHPYLGEKQIRNALDKLEKLGYIVVGSFNKNSYDRTKWYSVTKSGRALCRGYSTAYAERADSIRQKGQMDSAKRADQYQSDKQSDTKKESIEKESKTAYIDDEFCFLDGKLTDLKTGESVRCSPRPVEASADAGEANHTDWAQTPSRTAPESKQTRFTPPTIDECKAYCAEKGYEWDPEAFIDFYDSKGWMVGKSKMKDWKASMRNWNRGESRRFASKPSMSQQASTFKAAPKGKYDDLPF